MYKLILSCVLLTACAFDSRPYQKDSEDAGEDVVDAETPFDGPGYVDVIWGDSGIDSETQDSTVSQLDAKLPDDSATTDAAPTKVDAEEPVALKSACEMCTQDAECADGYLCVFRKLDLDRRCFPALEGGAIPSCRQDYEYGDDLANVGFVKDSYNGGTRDVCVCFPYNGVTCDTWLASHP